MKEISLPTSSPKIATTSKRLLELDVMRGLAALAVVFYHFTGICVEQGTLSWQFDWGVFGPHLFFIISGFVIFMTLERTETALDFLVSRFARLYPVYWMAVAIAAVSLFFFALPDETVTLHQTLLNLTMVQAWANVADLDISYWTLAIEIKFYLMMLGLFMMGWLTRIDRVVGLWLLGILVYLLAVGPLGLSIPSVVAIPLNAYYGNLFIAGILFYRLKTDGNTVYRHLLLACCLATQILVGGIASTVAVSVMFVLFYAFVSNRLNWIVCRPLVWFGSISYALYLLHGPIVRVIVGSFHGTTVSPGWLMFFALTLSIGVSEIVTRRLEQPANRQIRKSYQRIRSQQRGRYFGLASVKLLKNHPSGSEVAKKPAGPR